MVRPCVRVVPLGSSGDYCNRCHAPLERDEQGHPRACWAHPHWCNVDGLIVITYGTHRSPFRIGSMIKYAKENSERYHVYGVSAVLYNFLEANWDKIVAAWDPTLVTFVPSHPNKVAKRGFEFLADVVDWYPVDRDRFGIKRALAQVDATEQPDHDREPSADAWAPAEGVELEGARVLVIDDVVTSGATFAGIATMLRERGASRVYGLGIARAVTTQAEKQILEELAGQDFDWSAIVLEQPE